MLRSVPGCLRDIPATCVSLRMDDSPEHLGRFCFHEDDSSSAFRAVASGMSCDHQLIFTLKKKVYRQTVGIL